MALPGRQTWPELECDQLGELQLRAPHHQTNDGSEDCVGRLLSERAGAFDLGALGGSRTPSLLIRSKTRPSRPVRSCRAGLLARVVGGCLVQPHPASPDPALANPLARSAGAAGGQLRRPGWPLALNWARGGTAEQECGQSAPPVFAAFLAAPVAAYHAQPKPRQC